MVGVFMPPHFLNYLGLYVIFTNLTKATPLRTAFHDWVQKSIKELPEKKLIENVIKKYQSEWEAIKFSKDVETPILLLFSAFKTKISEEMIKKDVSYSVCTSIIKKIKQ